MLAFLFSDFLFPTAFSHFRGCFCLGTDGSGANKESRLDVYMGYVPVAQLDRASDYGSEGRGFESSRARHQKTPWEIAENGDSGAFFCLRRFGRQR